MNIYRTHVASGLGRGRKKSPRRPKWSNFSCFLSASPKRLAAAVTIYIYTYDAYTYKFIYIHTIFGSMYIMLVPIRYYYTFTVRFSAVNNKIYNIDG